MTPTPPDTRNGASDPQGVGQTLHRWLMAAGALMGTGALFQRDPAGRPRR